MQYPVLEVRGLVNRFGDQVVHDGLDMQVDRDEVFGIAGARMRARCASTAATSRT